MYLEEKRHIDVSVAEMLKITREFAGLSQAQLAKLSNVPQSAISAIENERLDLGVERARRLGDAMGVHPGTLLYPGWRRPGLRKA
jgi:transcriptional regulator with XRE-family HTH domain